MIDAVGGALCVFAVVAMMEALRASGGLSAARRRVLWEIGAMGAVVVLAHALGGSADAVFTMLVALGIAGGAAAVCARFEDRSRAAPDARAGHDRRGGARFDAARASGRAACCRGGRGHRGRCARRRRGVSRGFACGSAMHRSPVRCTSRARACAP